MRLNALALTIRGILMAAKATSIRGIMSASLLASVLALGGCGAGGVDVEFDAPILNAAGINLTSKKKDESDLPERPGLVVPPSTAKLPEPGERQANAAQQNWPDDPDLKKKDEAEAKQAARDKYCAEGDWSGKGGISEYDKALGREQRCPSKLGEAVSKTLGGRPAKDE
jgi:hypothetical protein